jgi:phosphatidate cytidylyltransferase
MTGTVARVLTAVVLIPIVVSLVLWGPTWLVAVVVAGIILLALHEFFAIGAKMNMPGYPRFTMLCALGLLVNAEVMSGMWNWATAHNPILWELVRLVGSTERVLFYFVVGIAALTLKSTRGIVSALPDCAVSAAGMLFIAWPLSKLIGLHAMWPMLLLFTLVLVWAGDTAAFFVGRAMGKHLLAPVISPKKTVEGALANVFGSLLAGYAFYRWQHEQLPLVHALSVAVLVSMAGQVGDLFESAWKRGAGVKDSGSLLPGHGGILDRIDALLLAAPVVWWYFQ